MGSKKITSSPALWLGIALAAAGGWMLIKNTDKSSVYVPANAAEANIAVNAPLKAVVYKSPSCGCCGNYVSYLKRQGYDVEVVQTQDMDSIKERYEIPRDMHSCHTTVIGDYAVEGHIPLEAVDKLLAERPDIRGIAMPGMPSGSPGMPGPKLGAFVIHGMARDGSVPIFMEL